MLRAVHFWGWEALPLLGNLNRVGALEFYVEGEHFPGAFGDGGELLFENFRQAFVPGDAE